MKKRYSGTENYIARFTDPNTIGDSLIYESAGNIGIGTTSPSQKLSISEGMNIDHDNSNNGTIDYGLRFGAGWSGEGIASKRTLGDNQWGLDFYTSSSNRMCITNSGNVGIGTTDPSQKLEINHGNILVRGPDGFHSNGDEGTLYLGNTPHYIKAEHGFGVKIGTYGIPGGDVVSIRQNTGRVGIGTTDPQQKLSVIGPIRSSFEPNEVDHIQMGHGGFNGYINWVGAGNLDFRHQNSTLVSIDDAGNVGVGTPPNSGAKLDVNYPGSGGAAIYGRATATGTSTITTGGHFTSSAGLGEGVHGEATGSQGTGVMGKATGNNGRGVAGYAEGTATAVYGNAPESGFAGHFEGRSYFDGNVGIGTQPTIGSTKLEVAGDLRVTGAYKGNIGPNNGTPFPRPAYVSGWVPIGPYSHTEVVLTHNIGSDPNSYVVDLQLRHEYNGITNRRTGWDSSSLAIILADPLNPFSPHKIIHADTGLFWRNLTDTTIEIYFDGYPEEGYTDFRVRIWACN